MQLSCLAGGFPPRRSGKSDRAVYRIRRRYGTHAVMRACVLGGDFRNTNPKEENIIFPGGFYDSVEIPLDTKRQNGAPFCRGLNFHFHYTTNLFGGSLFFRRCGVCFCYLAGRRKLNA